MRMQKSFWTSFDCPVVGLSPMDGVTDAPMRFIAKKYGNPDIIYTEFVSAEGLWRLKKKDDIDNKIWRDLVYDDSERPVIAQLFGSDPDSFYQAAMIVAGMGFDGIDINMGCPSPGLEKRGGGAGLMRDQGLAREVIEATREGVGKLPVSVKTRIGSTKPDESWWKFLAGMDLPAVAMHGRTFRQLYSGEADWEILLKAGEIIRANGTKFLANGDVMRCQISDDRSQWKVGLKSGKVVDLNDKADGVLIGREAVGNPWVLRKDGYVPLAGERLAVALEHARKFEKAFPGVKFFPMRKHLVKYINGFPLASELRKKMVLSESAEDVKKMVLDFEK